MARLAAALVGALFTLACTKSTDEPQPTDAVVADSREPCTCDAEDRRRGEPSRAASFYVFEAQACVAANGGDGCDPSEWLLEEVAACIVCRQTASPRLTDGWYLKFRDGRMRWGVVEQRSDGGLVRHEVDANDGSYSTAPPPAQARLIYEPGSSTDPCGADLRGLTPDEHAKAQNELDERYAEMLAAVQHNAADPSEFCDYQLRNAALIFRAALPGSTERAILPSIGLIEMAITGCAATATDWYGRAEAIYLGFAAATRAGDQTRAKTWRELLQREYPRHEFTARALACP